MRQLLAFLGVGRGGDGEGELQQFDLAGGDGIEREAIEARGLLGVLDRGVDFALVEFGGDILGVVGDEGVLDPVGAVLVDLENQELLLGVVDELPGIFRRRFGSATRQQGESEK